ncbi:MAG: ABC-2 family transporter protein [Bdellovibrionales bacterium]|nr:ABC-2 family transporter protein [Bdellovibrionales bacterium]
MKAALQLIFISLKYNLSAHWSNLPNLLASTFGMLLNNTIFLTGMWTMLFAGRPENQHLLNYYIALNALIMISWGAINFFFGGWIDLGEIIVNGQFESKLASPRHPLLLVSFHSLHPSALGDLLMGLVGVVILAIWAPPGMTLRTLIATGLSGLSLFALYVFSGSLAFFVSRGNILAHLVREMVVSLSSYPVGKIFPNGLGRTLLLLTPAGAVSILPLEWIETAGIEDLLLTSLSVGVLLFFSLWFYSVGSKRFQSLTLIGAQS